VDHDLDFALDLADLADSISLARFRAADLRVETKPDLTPVCDADRAVEDALRVAIAAGRPGEAVLGEEEGGSEPGAGALWVVDPIDGTRNYVRGIPIWATLIALERDGELVAAVASAPALGRRWWASRGGGSFADGSAIRVSGVRRIEDATFCYTSARSFAKLGLHQRFLELATRSWVERGFGDFWMHMLVAEGAADIAVDTALERWDVAAVQLIVEEAGGRVTDLTGAPHRAGAPALSTNGALHDTILGAFSGE
jgi:histidinol-phosphatase